MFVKVNLYTPEGGFVTTVTMPNFKPEPQVLVWGARTFVYVDSFPDFFESVPDQDPEDGCYVEAFAYHVPPMVAEMPDGKRVSYPSGEPLPEYKDPRLPHEREVATPDSFGGSDYPDEPRSSWIEDKERGVPTYKAPADGGSWIEEKERRGR
jgi:hypothetical protein